MMFDSAQRRLGFAVKVIGQPDLKSHDARRWQNAPHLRTSLTYLHALVEYVVQQGISMYRMSSDLAPYVTHPDLPQFHGQIAECAAELSAFGDLARQHNLRLSFHPSQFVVLNSPDLDLVEKSTRDLVAQAALLDAMELGPEAVLVIHVGGLYGDRQTGCQRWIETYRHLPELVQRRLVLENDDIRYSAADVLFIHEQTGVPLVFDNLHFWCNNPEQLDLAATLERFVTTWPAGVRPKIHVSSPRTEMREIKRKHRTTGKLETVLQPPVWTGHADYVNPFEFATLMRMAQHLTFDVMLEAKAKDVALLRLARDLPRYAPDIAAQFGEAAASHQPAMTPEDTAEIDEAAQALLDTSDQI